MIHFVVPGKVNFKESTENHNVRTNELIPSKGIYEIPTSGSSEHLTIGETFTPSFMSQIKSSARVHLEDFGISTSFSSEFHCLSFPILFQL